MHPNRTKSHKTKKRIFTIFQRVLKLLIINLNAYFFGNQYTFLLRYHYLYLYIVRSWIFSQIQFIQKWNNQNSNAIILNELYSKRFFCAYIQVHNFQGQWSIAERTISLSIIFILDSALIKDDCSWSKSCGF